MSAVERSKMYLLLSALTIPGILYKFLFRLLLLAFFVSIRVYCTCASKPVPTVEYNKEKLMMINKNSNRKHSLTYSQQMAQHLALALIFVTLSGRIALCLEEDVPIVQPLANLAKSIIATVTLGVPIEFNIGASDLMKSFALLTWRTGFPISMPEDFMGKSEVFYNEINARVEATDVKLLRRKTLADLKLDLDIIVDSIVEEVRQSPDGVYTDYTQTRVNGTSLEDACVAIGLQLKAYKTDLSYYRSIAEAVLGVPLMPTIASGVVNGANLTSTIMLMPIDHATQLSNSAMNSLAPLISTGMGVIQSPLSLFSSRQNQPAS